MKNQTTKFIMDYREFGYSFVFIILGFILFYSGYKNPNAYQLKSTPIGNVFIGLISIGIGVLLLLKSIFHFEIH